MTDPKITREVDEYFELGARVQPGDTVFDIGANVGVFAEQTATRCAGDVSLYCFEPVPPIFERLERQFRTSPMLRDTRHQLINAGLTASPSQATILFSYFRRLPTDSTYNLADKRLQFLAAFETAGARAHERCEDLLPAPFGRWLGTLVERLVAGLPTGPVGQWMTDVVTGRTEIECAVTTLNRVVRDYDVNRIDLMKIDVEGAEIDVIRGGDASTWGRVQQLVLEGHSSNGRLGEVTAFLGAHGLKVHRVVRPGDATRQGLDNYLLWATR